MSRVLYFLVFAVGLAVACWVGVGYVGTNQLALAVTAIIVAAYAFGGLELFRFQQATETLLRALESLTSTSSSQAPSLDTWLSSLHPSLRVAVRLRVEGERVALPGPSLTPYLVGLLVLLGMLGTFLGMVATLRGTGLALENATDLQAIRASLAAPVKGLGFAFGTSVAGVAASAMLGLLAALCRRDRVRAAQQLDAAIATTLRKYSKLHQREEGFKLMQQQAQALPLVADRLQTMIETLEKRSATTDEQLQQKTDTLHQGIQLRAAALDERLEQESGLLYQRLNEHAARQGEQLVAGQDAFHAKLAALYSGLTASVQQSLAESMAQAGDAVGAAVKPVLETTLVSMSRENTALQRTIERAVQQQLEALSAQFEQRSTAMVDGVAKRLEGVSTNLSASWHEALTRQQSSGAQLAVDNQQALAGAVAALEQHSASLISQLNESNTELKTALTAQDAERMAAWAATVSTITAQQSEQSQKAAQAAAESQKAVCDTLAKTAADITKQAQEQAAAITERTREHFNEIAQQTREQTNEITRQTRKQADEITQLTREQVSEITQKAREQAAEIAKQTQEQAAEIAKQTRDHAAETAKQTREHASSTIAEIERLVQAASEAPKAAADLMAQMRDKLSESMARDNAMLEERGRLLETLATLLDAVNHASTEQRTAVDALLSNSSNLLDRIGTQVTDKVETEAAKLGYMASQVTGSAIEMAGLGDTFGKAVNAFGESNATLVDHLQRIEQALDKTLVRSDEQLAYYVAQAREVVDLSLLSQKQILEALQQQGGQPANGSPSKGAK